MTIRQIDDPRKWRISMSGFSIKTGWGNEYSKFIAKYPHKTNPVNPKQYTEWLENAEKICDLYNATLTNPKPNEDGVERK